MSLDVYLVYSGEQLKNSGSGIFVRENGGIKEISRAEWDEKFPGCDPVSANAENDNDVFWYNITGNLGRMADEAGLYEYLWRPEEVGVSKAGQLIEPLEAGLAELKARPDHYKIFNPSNGWGDYDGLVEFVSKYLDACKIYPSAEIRISR